MWLFFLSVASAFRSVFCFFALQFYDFQAGLVIQTVPGAILIGNEDPMASVHAPLLEILSLLGISEDEVYEAIEEGGYYDE